MSGTTAVSCRVCGRKLFVSPEAYMSVAQLQQELPEGWVIDRERDAETGQRVATVRCPDHRNTGDSPDRGADHRPQ